MRRHRELLILKPLSYIYRDFEAKETCLVGYRITLQFDQTCHYYFIKIITHQINPIKSYFSAHLLASNSKLYSIVCFTKMFRNPTQRSVKLFLVKHTHTLVLFWQDSNLRHPLKGGMKISLHQGRNFLYILLVKQEDMRVSTKLSSNLFNYWRS